jgi:hypothetical protein
VTRRDRIKAAASAAASCYVEQFPGQTPTVDHAAKLYHTIHASLVSNADFDATYWPTFEAMVNAINKRREQAPRVRRPRSVQMSDEEWGMVVMAAGAEAIGVGASAKDSTPAAWCRRVLLREAERVRKEGM